MKTVMDQGGPSDELDETVITRVRSEGDAHAPAEPGGRLRRSSTKAPSMAEVARASESPSRRPHRTSKEWLRRKTVVEQGGSSDEFDETIITRVRSEDSPLPRRRRLSATSTEAPSMDDVPRGGLRDVSDTRVYAPQIRDRLGTTTSTKKHLPRTPASLHPNSEFDFRRAPRQPCDSQSGQMTRTMALAVTRLQRSTHPLRSLKRQSTLQLEKKSELEWNRDALRGTKDQGVLLGGALALSLESSLVLS